MTARRRRPPPRPRHAAAPALASSLTPLAAPVALLIVALPPASAGASTGALAPYAECATRIRAAPPSSRAWPAPLDRIVSLRADDETLRAALDRLAAEARVRFSYSPELLPLGRPSCVAAGRTTVGDALNALLSGTGIAPVVAGGDQIVLAPTRASGASDASPEFARTTGRLERVVVTGTATGAPERASPFALGVLDERTLPRDRTQTLAQTFDGAVPGVWLWTQSPTSPLARYGSLRGASSFGVSAPKVYVDGIEVASPLLMTQLDPARVERVEVIRGPQGAALYGADAISGVVNIVTRHEGVGPSAPAAELRGGAGTSASEYAEGGVLAQDHALTLRAGSSARSAALGVSLSTLGAFVPGASARQLMAQGSARRVGTHVVVTGTGRFHAGDADAPVSPLLAGVPSLGDSTAGERQSVRQYTVGTTVTVHASSRWTHALIAGIDGYRLAGVPPDGLPVPSPTDSALRAARGGADRATLRLSSTARVGAPETMGATFTLGAEHSTARERTNGIGTRLEPRAEWETSADTSDVAPADSGSTAAVTWWSNTGVLAQGQLALHNALFVTGGARVEYVSGPANGAQVALLPMLGGAWVGERGPVTLKLRAAYGRGIRPARTVARGATWMGGRVDGALIALSPEEQSGVEVGADLLWGDRFALRATRFDQRASGLVQPVAVLAADTSTRRGPGGGGGSRGPGGSGEPTRVPLVGYQLQNVGAIDNRGWELQASSITGPLALSATLSLVGSRVHRLASGYSGDLRPGDRMLEVPARTLGLSATWSAARWSLSGSAARASDWVNYDRLALAEALAAAYADGTAGARPPVGARLREFWRGYDGVTRVNGRLSFSLSPRSSVTLSGDNLLNRQVGEPDNVTVVPGRTLTLGVRTGF